MSNITIFDGELAIRNALNDYFDNTNKLASKDYELHEPDSLIDVVSDEFITRLANDSWEAKSELRQMLRNHPNWVEGLQAVILDVTCRHKANNAYVSCLIDARINSLCISSGLNGYIIDNVKMAAAYFSSDVIFRHIYKDSLKEILPKLQESEKITKTLKKFFKAIGDDVTTKDFKQWYSKVTSEMEEKEVALKLFVSINPAHFLTMSNPYWNGEYDYKQTMVSCHALNSDYEFKAGCTGYARDAVSLIVFTASNPDDPATLNYRKTSRQMFFYEPGTGIFLQSRMYTTFGNKNSYGGVNGDTAEGVVYRQAFKDLIDACEGGDNWKKDVSYSNNNTDCRFVAHKNFGGYKDWIQFDDSSFVSIRETAFESRDYPSRITIGNSGLAFDDGSEVVKGVISYTQIRCENCGALVHAEDECNEVRDEHGNTLYVCDDCLQMYRYCCECGQYHHIDRCSWVESADSYVCDNCLTENYSYCEECLEYHHRQCVTFVDSVGREVCDSCLEAFYTQCELCGEYFPNDEMTELDGQNVCSGCHQDAVESRGEYSSTSA